MVPIKVQGNRFIDPQGRERIFHGVNFPMGKLNPPVLEEAFFIKSKALGFNVLRLGPCWSKLEPQPGQYDEAVLAIIDNAFDLAAKYDMYVFLDMHQDLYSDFGEDVGNGAPPWACLADGYKYKKPFYTWGEGYFWDKAVQRSFDHFWNNDEVCGKGLQDHFADLWRMLAKRYGDHPALFGFDVFNEPAPGTPGKKIFATLIAKLALVGAVSPGVRRMEFIKNLLDDDNRIKALDVFSYELFSKVAPVVTEQIRQFDEEKYQPFLERMDRAIREVTPNGILVLEHSYFSNLTGGCFARAPQDEAQVCYSPHAYDLTVDSALYNYASNDRVRFMFEEMRKSQLQMNMPVMVGEWGSHGPKDDHLWFAHIEFIQDLFDSYGWSNTYWCYVHDLYDAGWEDFIKVLCRPYPLAVNGTMQNFKVDKSTKTCTLWYNPMPKGNNLPTEFYLPNGCENVDAGPDAKISINGNTLSVITKSPKIVIHYQ